MPWIELHIKTTAASADALSDQLTLLGALAVTFQDAGDQPIYEPPLESSPLWQETIVIGLFDLTVEIKSLLGYFEQLQATGDITQFHLKHIEDEDWERRCLEHFKPMLFGNRLWICPSWHAIPESPDAVTIILDPGLAFGTGTHPTTSLCLTWLDNHIHHQNQVIDYGCGSGILSLAALKLGAKHVVAIDHDAQALTATRSNSERNLINPNALTTGFPGEERSFMADVLVANILAQPLIELAERFAKLTRSGGNIVLSGILREQVDSVAKAYTPWFTLEVPHFKEDWSLLTGIRK